MACKQNTADAKWSPTQHESGDTLRLVWTTTSINEVLRFTTLLRPVWNRLHKPHLAPSETDFRKVNTKKKNKSVFGEGRCSFLFGLRLAKLVNFTVLPVLQQADSSKVNRVLFLYTMDRTTGAAYRHSTLFGKLACWRWSDSPTATQLESSQLNSILNRVTCRVVWCGSLSLCCCHQMLIASRFKQVF